MHTKQHRGLGAIRKAQGAKTQGDRALHVSRMPQGMSVSRPQRRRQKDQSPERLSGSPSVVDFVTRGAQRE